MLGPSPAPAGYGQSQGSAAHMSGELDTLWVEQRIEAGLAPREAEMYPGLAEV